MKIKLDVEWAKEVLLLHHKIYNHPKCPNEIKDMQRLELMRIFGKEYDIKKLLEEVNKTLIIECFLYSSFLVL
jgi:hypothetical protein